MAEPEKVLVFHTAFIGDIVLMFPLLQMLRLKLPRCTITVVTIPAVADLVRKHAAVNNVIPYDKRGLHRGVRGVWDLAQQLKKEKFSVALVPHRSLRSALAVRLARVPRRIGFSTSSAACLFTDWVPYRQGAHEIDRDLALLGPLVGSVPSRVLPVVGVTEEDVRASDAILTEAKARCPGFSHGAIVAIAPGSVWATKRWPEESFGALAKALTKEGYSVALLGGDRDVDLCRTIEGCTEPGSAIVNAAGRLSLAGSAAFLMKCRALVSNDSAPTHLAMGVGTPVIALFGPTTTAIGFAPVGPRDRVLEVAGLPCRPCNIHGGNECPIGSFECMRGISVECVMDTVRKVISDQRGGNPCL
jgi:heptosyltransferase II